MKKRIICLLLVLAALLMAGCETISVNREKDMRQILATVGDHVITKDQIYKKANEYFSMYGYDVFNETLSSSVRTSIDTYITELLNQEVTYYVMARLFDQDQTLTAEDIAEINNRVDERIEAIRGYFGYDKDNPDAYEGDIDAQVTAYLNARGFDSVEAFRADQTIAYKYEKMMEAYKAKHETEELKISEQYYADLAAQQAAAGAEDNFASFLNLVNEGAYTASSSKGSYVLFKPQDYRLMRYVKLSYTEQSEQTLSDLFDDLATYDSDLSTLQKELTTAESALEDAIAEDDEAEIETQKQRVWDAKQSITDKRAQIKETEAAYDAALATAAQEIQDKIDAVKARVENGDDFYAIMEQYSAFEELQTLPYSVAGYLVRPKSTTYDPTTTFAEELITALDKCEFEGDVSEQVAMWDGIYFVELAKGAEPFVVPYETAHALIKENLDTVLRETVWTAYAEEMVAESEAVLYPSRAKWVY